MKVIGYIAAVLTGVWQRTFGETKYIANTYNAPNAGTVGSGIRTFKADEAITRNYVVKIGAGTPTTEYVQKGDSATEIPLGIALDEAEAQHDPISVFILGAASGTVKVVAAAAINQGALVQSNGDGTVKTCVSTGYPIGRALQAAQAAGDIIEITPILAEHALA